MAATTSSRRATSTGLAQVLRWFAVAVLVRGLRGRRNRVVLIPRRWYPAQRACALSLTRRSFASRGLVAKKPGAPGRARIRRKPIAQGMPDVSAGPVVPAACIFFAGGPWVAASARHSLRPLLFQRGEAEASLGRIAPRDGEAMSVEVMSVEVMSVEVMSVEAISVIVSNDVAGRAVELGRARRPCRAKPQAKRGAPGRNRTSTPCGTRF